MRFSIMGQGMEHESLLLHGIPATALRNLSLQGYVDSRSGLTRSSMVSQHIPGTGTMERMTPPNKPKNVV